MRQPAVCIIGALIALGPVGRASADDVPLPDSAAPSGSANEAPAPSASTDGKSTEEHEQDADAKLQFETGREFFNRGKFEEAAIAMKRAFELRPSYKILYYLGWAESETGNYARALNAYRGYLADAPSDAEANRIAEVNREVEKLRARVGSLQINCSARGAKVKVDNEVLGVTPLTRPISIDVGKHEIAVVDGGTALLTEVIRIAGGQEITLDATPKPTVAVSAEPAALHPEKAAVPEEAAREGKPKNPMRAAAFAGFGLTGALAAAAAVTGALALDRSNEIWDKCDPDGNCYADDYPGDFESDQGSLRTLGVTTDILIGVASATAVTSVILLVISRGKKENVAGSHRPAVWVASGPFGAAVSGRF